MSIAKPITLKSFADFEAEAKKHGSQGWLVDGLLPARGYVMLAGEAMVGKSLLIQAVVVAVLKSMFAAKTPTILGRAVAPARVAYLHLEHQALTFTTNMRALGAGVGQDGFSDLLVLNEFDLDSDAEVDELAAALDKEEIELLVIDSLRRATLGNENDSNDTVQWGHRIQRLVGNGRRLVVVIHHAGKGGGGPRGSTDLKSQVDSLLTLRRQGNDGLLVLTAQHHHAEPCELVYRVNFADDGIRLDVAEGVKAKKQPNKTVEDVVEAIVSCVKSVPGVNSTQLSEQVREAIGGLRKEVVTEGRTLAEKTGLIVKKTEKGAQCWYPAVSSSSAQSSTAPGEVQFTPNPKPQ